MSNVKISVEDDKLIIVADLTTGGGEITRRGASRRIVSSHGPIPVPGSALRHLGLRYELSVYRNLAAEDRPDRSQARAIMEVEHEV